jgi:2-C-methyl-D-erythritol 4-phosphate cytidylyltransferase
MHTAAIIAAGGRGKRMGNAIPKQFLMLGDEPVLLRTLAPFLRCARIDEILIAVPEASLAETERLVASAARLKPVRVIPGGEERQESVYGSISALGQGCDVVVIHDSVRPFVTESLIGDCIAGAERYGAVTVVRPVKETVKSVEGDRVTGTLDRSKLRITQTPQAFRADIILRAHERARNDGFLGTDDCMLVERLGYPVHIIEGGDENIKITTPLDLEIARLIHSHTLGEKEC